MKKVFFVPLVFCCLVVTAQVKELPPPPEQQTTTAQSSSEDMIFSQVEIEATFPGGFQGWKKYLETNLNANVPSNNNAKRGRYKVIIRFTVDKDGTLSDIRSETNVGFGMEREVIRIIKNGPKWTPGMQNGQIVKSVKRQPVTFLVQ
jgi:periplasmic protein TonB